jgi:hypothetical protein
MASPEERVEPRQRRKGSVLGVVAYVLVPGERRRRAAGHFRRAGFEVLQGVGALARPEKPPGAEGPVRRERIEIE